MREELIERDRTTTISPNTVAASVSTIVLNILPLGSWRLRKWAPDQRPGPSVTRKSIQFPSVHEFFPVKKAACGMGHTSKLEGFRGENGERSRGLNTLVLLRAKKN